MELPEILDKLEEIIKERESESTEENEIEQEEPSARSTLKELVLLIFSFLLNIIKAPYRVVARYLKNEIVLAIKKDAKLYGAILAMFGILFLLFTVLWLFISIAVGAYFYDRGESLFISVMYSLGFQAACIVLVALIAFISSRNIRSIKLIKSLAKSRT
jgi:hypothetical protein